MAALMIPRISILEQKLKTYYKFHFVTIRHENVACLTVFIERNPLNAVMALTDLTTATHFSSLSKKVAIIVYLRVTFLQNVIIFNWLIPFLRKNFLEILYYFV